MNKDLTVGKPSQVLWQFCLPMFGSIIFQQLYNIADSLVAGKFIGENALAAVGNSYEITLIFIAFAFGCNIGCSVVTAQLFGAGRHDEMKTAIHTALIASGVICGAYYALTRWYAENPSNLSQMLGGQLVPLANVWYYIVAGFALLGFILCGIGTATSIRKHLNV